MNKSFTKPFPLIVDIALFGFSAYFYLNFFITNLLLAKNGGIAGFIAAIIYISLNFGVIGLFFFKHTLQLRLFKAVVYAMAAILLLVLLLLSIDNMQQFINDARMILNVFSFFFFPIQFFEIIKTAFVN